MNGRSVYRQITLLLLLAGGALLALWWSNRPGDSGPGENAGALPMRVYVVASAALDTVINDTVQIAPPATALQALESAAAAGGIPLAVREYDFGRLVVSIGPFTAGSEGDWTYRVNDSLPPVGAGAHLVQEGDRVRFSFGQAVSDTLF